MQDMVDGSANGGLARAREGATGKARRQIRFTRTVGLTGSPVAHDANDQTPAAKDTVYIETTGA